VTITSADIVIWNALRDRLMAEHGLEEDDPAVVAAQRHEGPQGSAGA
jgi:hypothetical protein